MSFLWPLLNTLLVPRDLRNENRIFEEGLEEFGPSLNEQAAEALSAELARTGKGQLPVLSRDTEKLVEELIAGNPTWGAGKIALALHKQGIFVGVATIDRYLKNR